MQMMMNNNIWNTNMPANNNMMMNNNNMMNMNNMNMQMYNNNPMMKAFNRICLEYKLCENDNELK